MELRTSRAPSEHRGQQATANKLQDLRASSAVDRSTDDAARVPGLILLPSGLRWMILAIAVDDSLDPGSICEIEIEQYGKEFDDARAVVAESSNHPYILRLRTSSQELSELICCRAEHKRVMRNTRKHIAIVIVMPLLVWNPHAAI